MTRGAARLRGRVPVMRFGDGRRPQAGRQAVQIVLREPELVDEDFTVIIQQVKGWHELRIVLAGGVEGGNEAPPRVRGRGGAVRIRWAPPGVRGGVGPAPGDPARTYA